MNRRRFIQNVKLAICGLLTLAIVAAIVYITIEQWDFFNDPGWRVGSGGVRSRIEGGNLWYLLCLWFIGGAIAATPLIAARSFIRDGINVDKHFNVYIKIEGVCIGVVGCDGGWVYTTCSACGIKVFRSSTFGEIFKKYPQCTCAVIDGAAITSGSVKAAEVVGYISEHPEMKEIIFQSNPKECYDVIEWRKKYKKRIKTKISVSTRCSVLMTSIIGFNYTEVKLMANELKCRAYNLIDSVCMAYVATLRELGKTKIVRDTLELCETEILLREILPKFRSA